MGSPRVNRLTRGRIRGAGFFEARDGYDNLTEDSNVRRRRLGAYICGNRAPLPDRSGQGSGRGIVAGEVSGLKVGREQPADVRFGSKADITL